MLDTSTVILLGEITDSTELPDESVISAITLAELSVGPHVAHDDAERSARQQHLQQAESDFDVVPFDSDCARALVALPRRCGHRDASRRRAHTMRSSPPAQSHMLFRSTRATPATSPVSHGWTFGRSPTHTVDRSPDARGCGGRRHWPREEQGALDAVGQSITLALVAFRWNL